MKRTFGFTLIELMMVVAILGVLAVVAIPSYSRFLMTTKRGEAYLGISKMQHGAIAWFNEEHTDTDGNPMHKHFPHSKSPTGLPPTASSDMTASHSEFNCGNSLEKSPLFPRNIAAWNRQPFLALKFSINQAHYYRYTYYSRYTGKDAFYLIIARGDLDCDGVPSIVKATGWVKNLTGLVVHTEIFNDLASGKEWE